MPIKISYNIRSKFFQIFVVALVKWYTWLTIILLLFITRLRLYKLFRHISLKLITLFATNIPLALQVLSYFIILLKAWLYPTCSFLTVPFLYWLHIWQQYIIQHNVLNSFTFTLREHREKFLIRILHHA